MMLDRIEGLMRELQLLTDSLAHDLRSPLSRLRVKVERAISLGEGDGREAALNGLLQETDTIMRMLSLLLEIGRMEAMAGASRMDWIEPARVVTDLAEMYEPVLEEAGIAFACDIEGPVLPLHGHRELLAQALSNLIDNAMRHGGSGKALSVRLCACPDELIFSVEDRGPGIAPDQEAEARRRFGRLDAARSRPGAGLGLALVESVARLHRGRLELIDNRPGLVARIVLPTERPASARSAP
jgi:signal transduction histidine kinase